MSASRFVTLRLRGSTASSICNRLCARSKAGKAGIRIWFNGCYALFADRNTVRTRHAVFDCVDIEFDALGMTDNDLAAVGRRKDA
jgi:hypothetical protein